MAEGELPTTRISAEAGMAPLFTMANGFVNNLVQFSNLGVFMEDNNVHQFSDFGEIPVEDFVLFVMGFAVCAGIGALLALILPIAGCCVGCAQCCSCCCSCCGGRTLYQKREHSRGREFGCAAALAVIISTMMASVACSYVATEMYSRELDPETGTLEDIVQGVIAIDTYISRTSHELNDSVVVGIEKTMGEVIEVIDGMPNSTRDGLGWETGVQPSLDTLHHFTTNLIQLSYALGRMQNSSDFLTSALESLEHNLTHSRQSIQVLLKKYSPDYSEELHLAKQLTICINHTNFGDTAQAKDAAESLSKSHIVDQMDSGMANYSEIGEVIKSEVGGLLNEVKNNMETIEEEVLEATSNFIEALNNIDVIQLVNDIINVKPYFEEYGSYAYVAFTSMNTIMLLIVVLLGLGIVVGLCLPLAEKSSGCCSCTSRQGTRLLTAGSALFFIFSWVLALMLLILFVGGGFMESMACRHVMTYDSTMDYFERLLWVELQDDFSYNISMKDTIEECKHNHSLYRAVSAETNGFNLSNLLDLSDITDELDELRNVTVELPHVYILDPTINSTIIEFDETMVSAALPIYEYELSKDTTCIALHNYAVRLGEIATEKKDADLEKESASLLDMSRTLIPMIEEEKSQLQELVNTAVSIYPGRMDSEVNQLAKGEGILNEASNEIIQGQIENSTDVILHHVIKFTDTVNEDIKDNLGRCHSLFDAGVAAVYAPCVYFLYPVNALWFCYGWFLIFGIPAVAIAVQLSDMLNMFAAPQSIDEAQDMEPFGDVHHSASTALTKEQTTPFGIHSNTVYPESSVMVHSSKEKHSNKIHPMPYSNELLHELY